MTTATNLNPAPAADSTWKPPFFANPSFNTDPSFTRPMFSTDSGITRPMFNTDSGVGRPVFNTDPIFPHPMHESAAAAQDAELKARRARLVRAAALRSVIVGLGVCLLGIVVTAATYSSASNSSVGGHYVVAWGAIVFAALRAVRSIPALIRGK